MDRLLTRADLTSWAEDTEVELIFFDPPEIFDPAILGIIEGYGQEYAVLYDMEIVLANFIKTGMTPDEADEWVSFNVTGAYIGEHTPRFLTRPYPYDPETSDRKDSK